MWKTSARLNLSSTSKLEKKPSLLAKKYLKLVDSSECVHQEMKKAVLNQREREIWVTANPGINDRAIYNVANEIEYEFIGFVVISYDKIWVPANEIFTKILILKNKERERRRNRYYFSEPTRGSLEIN